MIGMSEENFKHGIYLLLLSVKTKSDYSSVESFPSFKNSNVNLNLIGFLPSI